MTVQVPRQLRRCPTYRWCAGHSSGDEREHRAAPVEVATRDGRELRLTLTAYGQEPPQVDVEVLLAPGGPALHVAEVWPVALVEASEALRGLVTGEERGGRPAVDERA